MVRSCCVCSEPISATRGDSNYCSEHCIEFENLLNNLYVDNNNNKLNNVNQFGSFACPPT